MKKYVRGDEYEEDEVLNDEATEEADDEPLEVGSVDRTSRNRYKSRGFDAAPAEDAADTGRHSSAREPESRAFTGASRSVSQLSVVLVKPERYENAAELAEHLLGKRRVVLNLEKTNRETARRLLDFLSGVAFANEGKIRRIANSTYIITPYNVDFQDSLTEEREGGNIGTGM
ncbi:MAG: cell division protein SepF [Clostridia bacterium]|nr:cell division protein SepF [Clostridia bacterium]